MSCKACDIKFLNFNTWKQHQIVVHDMNIKDWTLVYEQRDALKRNRAQKRFKACNIMRAALLVLMHPRQKFVVHHRGIATIDVVDEDGVSR